MTEQNLTKLSLGTALGRWKGLGPYYAMFPVDFAFHIITQYSIEGDAVFDPFAGRASSLYAATALGRLGYGIEINPVGWLYGHVKLKPAKEHNVLRRIQTIEEEAKNISCEAYQTLPPFFLCCYTLKVLKFLLAARRSLNWQTSRVDATLMAIILVYLHGKQPGSLSNQMRQGKAMAPDYSVQWWEKKSLSPPDINPLSFLEERVSWRYAKGIPDLQRGKIVLGDSTFVVANLGKRFNVSVDQPFNLLFTSPPYYSVTNYYKDQWLRFWMLGGPPSPNGSLGLHRNGFDSKVAYKKLLQDVFRGCAPCLAKSGIIYVRTDAREFTYQTTLEALQLSFPERKFEITHRPFTRSTQTALFGDKEQKPGEMDIVSI